MDRDLNLSGAFGGLRITNPDDVSEASPPESAAQSQRPSESQSAQESTDGSAGGLLGFDPSSYSTDAYDLTRMPSQAISESEASTPQAPPVRSTYSPSYPPTSPKPVQEPLQSPRQQAPAQAPPPQSTNPRSMLNRQLSRSSSQRNGKRASAVPPGYVPNPAAASAAAAAMSQRSYPNGRPVSTTYPPAPVHPPRDEGYRARREVAEQPSIAPGPAPGPRRVKSTSRKTSEAAQAGVPINEANHKERNYASRPPVYGGNVVPPRRQASHGMMRPRGDTQNESSGYLAGSPYALEGGPPPSSEEWQEKGAATKAYQTTDAEGRTVTRYTKKGVKDFTFGQLLGEGSYSQVHLAQDRSTLHEYAIKVLDKRHIIKERKVKYVNIEKDTLNRLTNHPGVVRLYYTFQDERSLYFVLDFAANGELLGVLKKMGTFDEECTRYYAAQLLDTVEYMHSRGVIHRDLKPENILLDKHMHTKITDFGTAKILSEKRSRASSGANGTGFPTGVIPDMPADEPDRANSFVGTAEYVSPELLTEKSACKASDLWAFGCIVYQLLAGRPPFKAANEYLTFQKIIQLDYRFPAGFPPAARDLIERCLVLDPRQRLTIEHIKNHEFFRGMKFGKHLWQQKAPQLKSYKPPLPGPIVLGGEQRGGQNLGPINTQLDPNGGYNNPGEIQPSHSTRPVHLMENSPRSNKPGKRPKPRVITDVPPPSQLDIEWSPILSKDNERILKLGVQAVAASAAKDGQGHKHGDKDGKDDFGPTSTASGGGGGGGGGGGAFKRFFGGGGGLKKKTRMVMVTSNGRLLVANGPDEKKLKFEANLVDESTSWRKLTDTKGLSYWCLETRDKHFSFEDPKHSSSDASHTTAQVQEWLEALDRARDTAISVSATGSVSGFSSLLTSATTSKSPTLNFGMGGHANDSTGAFSSSNYSVGGGGNGGGGGAGGPGLVTGGVGGGNGGASPFMSGAFSAAGSANDLKASQYANVGGGGPVGASGGNSGGPVGLVEQATNPVGAPGGAHNTHKPNGQRDEEAGAGAGGENSKGGMARGFKRFSKRQSKSGLAAVF